ncbi:PREDICTED: uncharacterized protein LOC105150178 [Acromyrmex echinatior]|uniref:Uncharacterized protein n=1 Tax=Acromyrmex echinatior TaxID=103372 RepID=F4WX26_ACREC|nr:PREDICTED: uncharacterized protein LOC105150178 [Acromyrmex echinatior]EGI61269.1 hypothetical protein G5I_10517 [Acromyrmex echinatior]
MWKVLLVLAFIAFACDISHDVLVHGDPARKPEIAERSGGGGYEHQELRGQLNDAEVSQSSAENLERSSEPPAGKWRSNGEALEPKWRDGDSVPLLPFSHYRSYTRDEVEDVEQEALLATSRRPFKYHYAIDQPDRPRGGRRLPPPDDYNHDASYRSRDENPDENYPRKRRRPLKNLQNPTFYEETIDSAASNDGKRGRNIVDSSLNDREVTWRYREAFQSHPNEYEHEFSDEEYLRPRPRKRRPPQNYEFALANEASSNHGNEESKNSPQYLPKGDEILSMESSNKERENALELKSLLKMQQEEGSSLSEILQRRNLTLNDLLKGKTDVINALKSRIADESDEYIEEMSRVMSDSLMKLAATVTPPWVSTQPSMFENITIKITTTSDTISDSSQMTNVTDEVSKRLEIFTNNTNSVKESEDDAEMTRSAHDGSWLRAPTTPLTLSTVITTSTLPPITINSAEYFLNDEVNAESTSDHATRLESLDEDEIMEFSDFTDFKKGKSSGPSSERIISQQAPRDTESTLSIEQILNPTERTKRVEGRENDQNDDINNNNERKMIRDNDQSVPIGVPTAEDYKTFIEAEYQSDASNPEDNGKQSKDHSSKIDAVVSQVEKKQTANQADDKKELRDKNHSADYHQVTRLPGERARDRTLANHRDTKRYEEVVSEIEPEARAEIFELFASGSAGKRLERLLKSRNMSVEELIALRQRGSSKVHLTEVSRLRMSKPKNHQTLETSNTNNGEIIISLSSTSNSNEHFDEDDITEREDTKQEMEETMNRFKDIMSYLHDPFFNKDVENMSMSRLLDLVERDRNASREMMYPGNDTLNADDLENSRRTMQIVDLLTTFDSLPFAKDVQQQFETEIDNNKHEPKVKLAVDNNNASVVVIDETEKTLRSNDSSEFHAGYVEEIVREEPNTIDIKTADETLSSMNDGEEKKTLSKMKPSIIASGAILGVTIVVFMAIFIVCRIRQKQKYTYRNTFSRAVFQGPVMAARKLSNSSSLSAVMVNVVATSTTKRPERTETQESAEDFDSKSDMDNDSLDANDSWETIPDYAK